MTSRFGDDLIGEALETGKSVIQQAKQASPGKIAKTAMEQVAKTQAGNIPPGLEDLKGKKPTASQLSQMRQNDNQQKSQQIDSTRMALKRMMIQRYQKMQQDILQAGKEKEQAEIQESQQELVEKKQKQEQEEVKQQAPVRPKRSRPKGFLGVFDRQKQGSKELGKNIAG